MISKRYNNQKIENVHFQKIVIFGENGVGKSSFISLIENFENDNYRLKNAKDDKIKNDLFSEDPNGNIPLVETIKKINVKINESKTIHYNLYEVNTDAFDLIKMNLDTLLFQVECIIFMYNNKETFNNIPKFINSIYSLKMQNINIPIFIVQNKFQNIEKGQINEKEVDKIIKKNIKENIKEEEQPNLIYKKISLIEKKDYLELFSDIYRNLKEQEEETNNVFNLVKFKYGFNYYKNIILDDYNNLNIIRIILLGESSTGKTTFINYLNKFTLVKQDNREENDYLISANIKNKECIIKITDTLGAKSKNNISKTFDGFLLFFDLTNKESFIAIDNYIKIINSYDESSAIILLGNKVDDNKNRHVKKQEVMEFVEKRGIKYYECSCKFGINIYEILNEISFMSFNKKGNKIEDTNIIDSKDKSNNYYCYIS